MGMMRRGNRDTLLTDRSNYERILRKYDRVEDVKERKADEAVVITLIVSVCLILTIGSILSIIESLGGI